MGCLGVSMGVTDRRCGWKVSRRCCWWNLIGGMAGRRRRGCYSGVFVVDGIGRSF